jgi:Uma2 family endonuclease
MAIGRTALTDRDYAALPDDGRRDQILDGALEVTPAPSPDHQDALANLDAVVRDHVKIHGRGRAFVEVLSPSTAAIDRGVKSRLYARHGVAYDWIVR